MSNWFRSFGFADVLDNLLIGAYPLDDDDVATLERIGIDRILNLVQDAEYEQGQRDVVAQALAAANIDEYRMELVDHGMLPPDHLELAVQEVLEWLEQGHRVYLHCRAGWQRSAAIAAGVVALRNELEILDALEHVQLRKPSAEPLPHQRLDLLRWWAERGDSEPRGG